MPEKTHKKSREISRFITNDGHIGELIFDPQYETSAFAVSQSGQVALATSFTLPSGERVVPINPENSLLKYRAVLLPEHAEEYGSTTNLVRDIESYIDRYVDLSPSFRQIAAHYVLLTWVYDAFNELPYFRFRGEPGSGKTRALLVVGSICYQAFLASGASTVSPIFHTLDMFRGTLVLDEADFRFSDATAELVKILNNGNVSNFPILRSVQEQTKAFNPRAFHVFGPKIIAMRHDFADRALESRFLTEEMGQRSHREDIPLNLPDVQAKEAGALRNRLLMYRFVHVQNAGIRPEFASAGLSSRMNQILVPLLSVTEDPAARAAMLARAHAMEEQAAGQKRMLPEALVLEVLRDLLTEDGEATVPLALVTQAFQMRFGADFERPVTGRYIGSLIGKRLHLVTYKTKGVYVVPRTELKKVRTLCQKFGIRED